MTREMMEDVILILVALAIVLAVMCFIAACTPADATAPGVGPTKTAPVPEVKQLPQELCYWQKITFIDDGEFIAWGQPQYGDRAELQLAESNRKQDQQIVSQCIARGDKTPEWIKPSGMARTADVLSNAKSGGGK